MSSEKSARPNRLADRLKAATSNLEQGAAALAAQSPGALNASARMVTMPAQLNAFRLEAEKYQSRIDELQNQLSDAQAAIQATGPNADQAAELNQRVAELEALRLQEQQEHDRQVEKLKEQLDELARAQGDGVQVLLELIDKVPGRQRVLPPEERASLKANLAKNKLTTPVTLAPKPNGRYDIISGHNRVDIYGELGRISIGSVLDRSAQNDGDKQAFYANLMHSSLPDFAKYQGFKALLASSSDMTITAIAEDSGVPRSTISNLMVFDQLPAPAIEALAVNPSKLGRTAAAELAKLTAQGQGDAVVAAVKAVIADEVTQEQSVAKVRALVRAQAGRRRQSTIGTPAASEDKATGQPDTASGAAAVLQAPGKLVQEGARLVLEFGSAAEASAALPGLKKLFGVKK